MVSRLTADQRSQIAEALSLSRSLTNNAGYADPELVQRRRDRIHTIQQELQAGTHPISRVACFPHQIPLSIRQAFVQAALLVSRHFAVGGVGWQGTINSPIRSQAQPARVPADWASPAGISALGDRFELPDAAMDEIILQLDQVDADIDLQRHLMKAVLQSVGVSIDSPQPLSAEPFVSLFQEMFDGVLLNPDQLSAVYTPTQLYFCVNFPPLEDFRSWGFLSPPEHQGALRELHQRLSSFTFQKFKRFPTFGPCVPAGINWEWAQKVCDRLNAELDLIFPVSPEQVIQRLSQSVGVLPQKDAEMFLAHDVWGHYWQLLFGQFESNDATLVDCGEALRLQETVPTPAGPLTCRDLFQFQATEVWVDADRAAQFFQGDVRHRLGLLFTHLLGELVADIAEFKFTWLQPQEAHQLPSASAFTDYPANLDLSLADLDFLCLRVLQPLLELHSSPLETSPLELELLAASPLDPLAMEQVPQLEINLKRAIAQLHQIFLTELGATYLPDAVAAESLFAELAVNLLQLQNVVNTLYPDPQFSRNAPIPFQELIIVFISHYCSGNNSKAFGEIANVLTDFFVPCWYLLDPAT